MTGYPSTARAPRLRAKATVARARARLIPRRAEAGAGDKAGNGPDAVVILFFVPAGPRDPGPQQAQVRRAGLDGAPAGRFPVEICHEPARRFRSGLPQPLCSRSRSARASTGTELHFRSRISLALAPGRVAARAEDGPEVIPARRVRRRHGDRPVSPGFCSVHEHIPSASIVLAQPFWTGSGDPRDADGASAARGRHDPIPQWRPAGSKQYSRPSYKGTCCVGHSSCLALTGGRSVAVRLWRWQQHER